MSIRKLCTKLQEKANSELNEVPERVPDDIKFIRDWLEKQPHLNVEKDDQWILSFLRACKFSLPRTLEKLDFFYTVRSLTEEFFLDRDPFSPGIQEILKRGLLIPAIKNTEVGQPVKLMVIWSRADPKVIPFIDIFKVALMYLDILGNEDDNFIISGQEIVHDMAGFSLGYMTRITPAICKKAMMSIQKAYPTRIKGLWFFNTPPSYEIFINMFKQFLTGKIKHRMKTFGEVGLPGIYGDSPLTSFPNEYGGEGGLIDDIAAEWKKKFESYRDFFLKDQELKSDETKRIGSPVTSADVFGVEGSFRKLTID